MNLEEYRGVFITVSLALILIATFPTLGMVVPISNGVEPFSELWVLGSTHTMNYPLNLRVGEQKSLFIGVGNHLGYSAYYILYVKFRNQTQPLPDALNSKPSPLPPIHEFRVVLQHEDEWETSLTFVVLDASWSEDSCFVGRLSINDVNFVVNCTSKWDSEYNGFYYQLFFELWLYNTTVGDFQYHERFVSIWLNMTV